MALNASINNVPKHIFISLILQANIKNHVEHHKRSCCYVSDNEITFPISALVMYAYGVAQITIWSVVGDMLVWQLEKQV